MFYGSVITKFSLDQFYTPITISSFIKEIVINGKKFIDPAGGTGDLLIELNGNLNIWEISQDAIEMAKLNYDISNKVVNIKHTNSLLEDISEIYDYCIMNPPFGSKTIITDKKILNRYELGINSLNKK